MKFLNKQKEDFEEQERYESQQRATELQEALAFVREGQVRRGELPRAYSRAEVQQAVREVRAYATNGRYGSSSSGLPLSPTEKAAQDAEYLRKYSGLPAVLESKEENPEKHVPEPYKDLYQMPRVDDELGIWHNYRPDNLIGDDLPQQEAPLEECVQPLEEQVQSPAILAKSRKGVFEQVKELYLSIQDAIMYHW